MKLAAACINIIAGNTGRCHKVVVAVTSLIAEDKLFGTC